MTLLMLPKGLPSLLRWWTPHLGRLFTPRHLNRVEDTALAGIAWAADNDAWSGWDEPRYLAMLERLAPAPDTYTLPGCRFVTAPDVVADAEATLGWFAEWQPVIVGYRLPVALVLQDGMTVDDVPWGQVDGVFVGGSTVWKLGADSRRLVDAARRRGKWTHMGRVNTARRLQQAMSWGVDSVDGTGWARFTDSSLPGGLRMLGGPVQGHLAGIA